MDTLRTDARDERTSFLIAGTKTLLVSPLKFEQSVSPDEFELHVLHKHNQRENSVHEVHVASRNSARLGWLIPINALASTSHDFVENRHFLYCAVVAMSLFANSPTKGALEREVEVGSLEVTMADLFHPNTALLVLHRPSMSAANVSNISRLFPGLAQYGYFDADLTEPDRVSAFGIEPDQVKMKVRVTSEDIERVDVPARLLALAAGASDSYLSKFFYLYQIVEFLMEIVLEHRLPDVARTMIRKLEAGRVSHLRRDVTSLSEAFVEGKRLNLLMETYGGHHVDLAPLSVAANRFLESVGVQSESQIDALYQVRNFVFHQGRNVLDSHAKLLSEVANEFAVVVPDLLARFQFPIRDYGMSAALSELNVEYAALATDETFLP